MFALPVFCAKCFDMNHTKANCEEIDLSDFYINRHNRMQQYIGWGNPVKEILTELMNFLKFKSAHVSLIKQ